MDEMLEAASSNEDKRREGMPDLVAAEGLPDPPISGIFDFLEEEKYKSTARGSNEPIEEEIEEEEIETKKPKKKTS